MYFSYKINVFFIVANSISNWAAVIRWWLFKIIQILNNINVCLCSMEDLRNLKFAFDLALDWPKLCEKLNERETRFVSERMGKGGGQARVRVSLWRSLTSDGFTTRMRCEWVRCLSRAKLLAGCGNRTIIFLREARRLASRCYPALEKRSTTGCHRERRRKPSPCDNFLIF